MILPSYHKQNNQFPISQGIDPIGFQLTCINARPAYDLCPVISTHVRHMKLQHLRHSSIDQWGYIGKLYLGRSQLYNEIYYTYCGLTQIRSGNTSLRIYNPGTTTCK